MKLKKASKVWLLSLLCVMLFSVTAFATSSEAKITGSTTIEENTEYGTLEEALDAANDDETQEEITITLLANVATEATLTFDRAVGTDPIYGITLDLDGYAIDAQASDENTFSVITVAEDAVFTLADNGTENKHDTEIFDGTGDRIVIEAGLITGGDATGGGVHVSSNATFTMDGGTIAKCEVIKTNGGGVYVGSEATFTMNGGRIVECDALVDAYGGGVYVYNDATFTMNEGTIENCYASTGGGVEIRSNATFDMEGGTISNNKAAYGGGVYNSSGSFNMLGGIITGNTTSSTGGGGVYCFAGAFTMTGGEISSNTAATDGAGVYCTGSSYTSDSVFIMNGGTIKDNTVGNGYNGDDIYIQEYASFEVDSNDDTTIEIAGEIYLDAGKVIKFTDAYTGSSTFNVKTATAPTDGNPVVITSDAEIVGVDDTDFVSVDGYPIKVNDSGEVQFIAPEAQIGDTKYETLEDALTAANADTSEAEITITLLANVETEATLTFTRKVSSTYGITLDLNGYAIDAQASEEKQFPVIKLDNGAIFTLKDSNTANETHYPLDLTTDDETDTIEITTGLITGGYETVVGTGGIYAGEDATFTMTGGTIAGNLGYKGGGIYTGEDATFTMTGGTITGNKAKYGGTSTQASNGGGVYIDSGATFDMEGGTIDGNTAQTNGGGVYNAGTFNMSAGTISGNDLVGGTKGGGVYNYGTFNMTGGTIEENEFHSIFFTGTAFNLQGNDTLTIDGMIYIDGSTSYIAFTGEYTGSALEVYTYAKPTIETPVVIAKGVGVSGVTVDKFSSNEGYSVAIDGDNVQLVTSEATITGGDFDGNKYASFATALADANSDETGEEITITINENVSTTDTLAFTRTSGGIIVDLDGYSIDGSGNGGKSVITVGDGAELTINDTTNKTGSISGGDTTDGGGIYIAEGGTLTMTAGIITGNTATGNGGGVYIANRGTFNAVASTELADNIKLEIYYNTATCNGGGVYIAEGGTFAISGGATSNRTTISSNTATGDGDGIYNNGTLTLEAYTNIADELYLPEGKVIGFTGHYNGDDDKINIIIEATPTLEAPVKITSDALIGDSVTSGVGVVSEFNSVQEYAMVLDDGEIYLEIAEAKITGDDTGGNSRNRSYTTLEEALDILNSDITTSTTDVTITLLANVTTEATLSFSNTKVTTTLDLNGFTITAPSEDSVITIAENANLILADDSEITGDVTNNGTFTMTSGKITGNVTNNGTFNISGTPTITGEIYLANEKVITFTDTYTGTSKLNVTTQTAPTLVASPVVIASGAITGGVNATNFVSVDGHLIRVNGDEVKFVAPEAQIGDTKYETLEEAMTAANGNNTTDTITITLYDDVTIEDTLNFTRTSEIKLDLDVFTITTTSENPIITVAEDAIFTLEDNSKITGDVTINGTFTMTGGKITGNVTNNGTFNLSGDTTITGEIYLNDAVITFIGAYTGTSKLDVTIDESIMEPVVITANAGEYEVDENDFYNSNPDHTLTLNDDGEVQIIPTVYEAKIGETKYATLEDALAYANSSDSAITITLLTNVETEATLSFSNTNVTTTLDLDGFTITTTSKDSVITIAENADFTMTNGTIDGDVTNNGTFTMTSGTITGDVTNEGTFNISGNPTITGEIYLADEKVITFTDTYTGSELNVKTQTIPVNKGTVKIATGADYSSKIISVDGYEVIFTDATYLAQIDVTEVLIAEDLGSTIEPYATLNGHDTFAFNEVTELTVTVDGEEYEVTGTATYTYGSVTYGTYEAVIAEMTDDETLVDGDTVTVAYAFTINATTGMLQGEITGDIIMLYTEEAPTYSADGNTIYAKLEAGTILGTVSILAPTGDLSYDNSAKSATLYTEHSGVIDTTLISISYTDANGDAVVGEPTDAGTYTASITVTVDEIDYTASISYTITKVPVTFTATGTSFEAGATPNVVIANDKGLTEGTDYTVTYGDDVTLDATTSEGTYSINITLINTNYSLSGVVGSVVVYTEEPVTYTVSFDVDGGDEVVALSEEIATTVRTLPTATKDGYVFTGWTYDGATYQAGTQFIQPEADVVMTANWILNSTTISGTVSDTDGALVDGATVELLDNTGTQVATAITDATGVYSFTTTLGEYTVKVTVEGVSASTKVDATKGDVADLTIVTQSIDISSDVVVQDNVAPTSVNNLADVVSEIIKEILANNPFATSVDVKLEVAEAKSQVEVDALLTKDKNIGFTLDISMNQTINNNQTSSITETPALVHLTVELPADMQGKDNYKVYRYHGVDIHTITTSKNTDGEYIEVIGNVLHLYVNKFSTYAVASSDNSSNTGGGTGGSIASYYVIDLEVGENGTATSSLGNALAGKTVTITTKANEGYEVAEISADGVTFTDNGDGTYSYTQPSADVVISVTFKLISTDTETNFTDVYASDWYYNYVYEAFDAGIMNGTSDTTFSPETATTRAMIVTMLYRLSGEVPVDSIMTFEDVSSDEYYTEAVRWAQANGIVTGYSDTEFAPDKTVSRQETAVILYRYAMFINQDVSVGESTSISSYNDASDVAEYAIPSMQWVCGAGIINGDTNQNLNPEDQATRAEIAKIFVEFMKLG